MQETAHHTIRCKKDKFIQAMDKQLIALIKKEYPALSDIDNLYISELFSRIRNNPNARTILIEARRRTLAPLDFSLAKQALCNFQLPEGWGDFLLDLAKPLIEGIPLDMIYVSTANPWLITLVKMVIIHGLFIKKGRKEEENAIITRSDSIEIARDEAYAESLAVNAQELLNILKLMPTLRDGRTRLFRRMLSCIEEILETPY